MTYEIWRNTTEEFGITLTDQDTGEAIILSDLADLRIVISQGDTEISRQLSDGSLLIYDNTAIMDLTQDDTRSLQAGTAHMQAHILFTGGSAKVSEEIAELLIKDTVDRKKI